MNRILIVKSRGGLGNRVLSLLPSLAWAEKAGRCVFVDWEDGMYAPRGKNAFDAMFDYSKAVSVANRSSAWDREVVRPAIWQGCLSQNPHDLLVATWPRLVGSRFYHKKLSSSLYGSLHDSAPIVVHGGYMDIWKGAMKAREISPLGVDCGSRLAWLRSLFSRYLRVPQEIMTRVKEAMKEIDPGDPILGIHFRNTDRSGNIKRYLNACRRYLGKNSAASVVLCSDDPFATVKFEDGLGRSIITLPREVMGSGGPLHFGQSDALKEQMAREALADVVVLSLCSHLVFQSSSTFGVLAHIMSSQPSQTLFDVERRSVKRLVREATWRVLA